jgi:hypothetical protein
MQAFAAAFMKACTWENMSIIFLSFVAKTKLQLQKSAKDVFYSTSIEKYQMRNVL